MTAQIEVPAFLGHLTRGVKLVRVKGETVGECLNSFVKEFPGTKELLFDRDDELLKYIDIYINGVSSFPQELGKAVHEGDTLSMLYLVVGG
jgi:molybdopterin converting factor small subunit